ncbi:unnamed protein product [Rhizophagus irregularis]|uniref:BED-type domain-containing protein n=2 Tax=Rhizophagus irregularis TaxID=588596 RepID=A0A916E9G3_9GLOM|nr:unnamed protein product [Rhizophagus irregularis]CAB5372997.1 unnamed protein product [Rhizophagus irregularis]
MTRTLDPVWDYFKKSTERKTDQAGTKQHYTATCNFCDTIMTGQPKRMKIHLNKNCLNVPLEVKNQYKNKDKEQESSDVDNDNTEDNVSNEKEEIDTAIARAFYASGIPLATIENPFIIQALHKINPEYHPPSQKSLSTTLLEKEYKQVSADMKKQIKNSNYICLTSDGWTNIHQQPIINFMITTPQPIFWKALESKENSHTGEYIAEQFDIVIKEIGISKIAAVITDNASNMKKAHSILQKDYPNIIFLGCFAHNINLLIKSVIELTLIKEIITPVQEIIKFFKRHHIENACLERLQIEKIGKTIKFNLPVITRWGSHHICLQSFLASKKALQNVVFEECVRKSIPSSLNSKLIDTEGFWVDIEEICQLLEPFTKIIREFESNQPNLSLVYNRFTKLKNEIKQLTNTSLKDIILDKCTLRWEKMYHPAIVIAYYLDPRYHGQNLTDEYPFSMIAEETSKFVNQDLSGQLVKELLWYNNKTGPFNSSIFWKLEAMNDPIDWWNGFQKEVPVLSKFAVKLMSIPASNAASERNWSNFGFIQNIKRNRLTNERTFKLVSIYSNLRLANGQKLNDDNINEEELENLDEIIVIEESEESNIEH